MHGWSHKSVRENHIPSFSSSLLDEIYRSMDDKPDEFELPEDKVSSLQRPFLVQNLTVRTRPSSMQKSQRIDDGPFFVGSVRSSIDSSSRHVSKAEGFCELRSQKPSCFGPLGSKPRKADVFSEKHQHVESDYCLNNSHLNNTVHGPLIKSKARALKIYANLKKVKQPISPGGRLTTFLNSLLSNRHIKKPKDLNGQKIDRTSKASTCSSTSSFTKSCLSKNSPRSREKLNNGIQRTVSFDPVSVIIDEDCRPCDKKITYAEQDFMNVHSATTMSKTQSDDDDEENDYYDMTSDASSDLFELDHLSTLQELPVFETTHFDTKMYNC
ncbi:putative protein BIG GRAIN 1 [Helianthus anomalus]